VATDTTGQSGLAGRYAVALYDLADQSHQLDVVAGDLKTIRGLLDESADLRQMVRSPVLKRAEQSRAILAVLKAAGVSELTLRFVGVTADNRRLAALPAMIDAFLRRLAEKRGEVAAEVTSAKPLNEAQLARVTEQLKRAVGGKVVIDLKVDPGLIGGLVVRVGSKLIDNSLKTKLMRLQLAMKGVG
jgi:F-type H+-transporting ATPase subunit delta